MSIQEFLTLLSQGGASVGLGVFVSRLLEMWPAFQSLTSEQKRMASFGLLVTIPVLATLVLQLCPPEYLAAMNPIFQAITAGVIAWGGGEVQHRMTKKQTLFKYPPVIGSGAASIAGTETQPGGILTAADSRAEYKPLRKKGRG